MSKEIHHKIFYTITVLIMLLIPVLGDVFYYKDITVSNNTSQSHWGSSHSTNELNFISFSNCKGNGNSSKYINIEGFAGIQMKETTHSDTGRLKEDRSLSIQSRVDLISIDESVGDNAQTYEATITDITPTAFYDYTDIKYRGDGIRTRSIYNNNDDKIMTNYYAKDFSKTTGYIAKYEKTLINVYMTPSNVYELMGRNYSTFMSIDTSSDISSEFRFKSDDMCIDDYYKGSFNMKTKLFNSHLFNAENVDVDEWLQCCILSGYPEVQRPFLTSLCCNESSALRRTNTSNATQIEG